MGTWGCGVFENDETMDWVIDVAESPNTAPVRKALDVVARGSGYLEGPVCDRALAACEVVAALRGSPTKDLPEAITSWVQGRPAPPPGLLESARVAVRKILADSELKELWQESGDSEAWRQVVENLQKRLA
jgi:hypothetical protein